MKKKIISLSVLIGIVSFLFTAFSRLQAQTNQPTIEINPSQISANQNETFTLRVKVDPAGTSLTGVDLVLEFDQQVLEVVDVLPRTDLFPTFAPTDDQGNFDKGRVIQTANTTGQLAFGSVIYQWSQDQIVDPVNQVVDPWAEIVFRVKTTQPTTITMVFNGPGQTTDSNLATNQNGQVVDVLQAVVPGEIAVNGGGSGSGFCAQCPNGTKSQGDADCDGEVNLTDFSYWLTVYQKILNDEPVSEEVKAQVDFDCQEGDQTHTVDLADYIIWLQSYQAQLGN